MRHPSHLVLEVINDLKGRSLFDKHPFNIAPICQSIQRICGDIPIEFWEVDYAASRVIGCLEYYEQSSGVYGSSQTVALMKHAKMLNLCWTRFVQVKEMSHIWLDSNGSFTDTEEKFEGLLERLASREFESAINHDDFLAEQVAVICAQEILFPQELRKILFPHYESGAISSYRIALHFRIPERIVEVSMRKRWMDMTDRIIYNEKNA